MTAPQFSGSSGECGISHPRILRFVELEVVGPEACGAGDNEICATGPTGAKDACYGDSGGPLVGAARGKDGEIRFVQLGVVGGGFQCENPREPGAYPRV